MSSDLLNITVNIAGRPYRMKVSSDEETNVREAANMINSKIAEFQKAYSANDNQDYLAMAALLYTSEFIKKESAQETISDVIEDALSVIDQNLKEVEQELP